MKNMADHNKRTIWYHGPAGPLVPKGKFSLCLALKKATMLLPGWYEEHADHNKRTILYHGPAGPLAPKGKFSLCLALKKATM